MRQLAAREGRDRSCRSARRSRAGPCRAPIAARVASRPPAAAPRPRSPSSPASRGSRNRGGAGAAARGRRVRPARRWRALRDVSCHAGLLATPSPHRRFSAGPSRPARPLWPRPGRSPVLAVERQVVGDRRAVGGRELRIVPHLVEDEHARAELERLGDVVRDHEYRHAVLAPDLGQQLLHVDADAGIERAERLVEQQDLAAARAAPGRSPGAAACRRTATPGSGRAPRRGRPCQHRLGLGASRLAPCAPKTRPNRTRRAESSTSSRFSMTVRCGKTE